MDCSTDEPAALPCADVTRAWAERPADLIRALLICQADEPLNRIVLARWLASFSELAGILVLKEPSQRKWRRIRREIRRVGLWQFLDVLAFRLYYNLCLAENDRRWERETIQRLCRRYPEVAAAVPVFTASSPNSAESREFIERAAPDLMIARCKTLLKPEVFLLPRLGTYVMHPGICPEYRNAHGCFWALASGDRARVGMTLLKVDAGVDTGPVYGYFQCAYDEQRESHIVIQHRTVFDNLDAIRDLLVRITEGRTEPINTAGRQSRAWGQPWMSAYLRWKRGARRRG